ncbi:aspartate aminotransferase family protein [Hyphomicrobium methylovorum]|uniref:aspartate aminotransferase family protein n=1 Tax=Hyphomicrobium methylovorum TaxID=84 RepID=UPI0015E636E3|nr:aspartate aminotransferase family protein [Hyphomicrobium methylovorum]MBA2124959.1 aspartate aminotransferase family protein [Hyphomicrobium methylovorum]
MTKSNARAARQILDMNAYDAGQAGKNANPLLAQRIANVGAASVLFYREPIEVVSASGSWMTAADGTRYLDFYNNVLSVGHSHPRVVAAVTIQISRLNINSRYLNSVVDRYLDALKATLPDPLSNIVLSCSGSEANDLAIRIAAATSGGTGIIVSANAYHGNTSIISDISPSALKRGSLPDHVVTVAAPSSAGEHASIDDAFAAEIDRAIAELKRRGHSLSAFICDSIFSSDGVYADPPGFLRKGIDLVRKAGGIYIADEVQPGFARTGEAFWGFARHGVIPDIVTMGKPMGNGFPMSGLATRPALLERFCADTGYFSTFGGNPVAAAAGMAVLNVIEEERLQANALRQGNYIKERLRSLAEKDDRIADVRGAGLFLGIELSQPGRKDDPNAELATAVINGLKERRVLIGAAGTYGNTLKVRPPLSLSQEEADIFVDRLSETLADLPAKAAGKK